MAFEVYTTELCSKSLVDTEGTVNKLSWAWAQEVVRTYNLSPVRVRTRLLSSPPRLLVTI